MDLSNIADQLDNFKTVVGALAELTKLPQGIIDFLFGGDTNGKTAGGEFGGFSSQVGDFKDTLSSKLSSN